MKIVFRKIYEKLEEGQAINSIIAYQKIAIGLEVIAGDCTPDSKKFITKYKKGIFIDLYFLKIYFDF